MIFSDCDGRCVAESLKHKLDAARKMLFLPETSSG